jgi:replication factor C small subunit
VKVWIEKYRPKKLDDIIGQDIIIKRLKSYVKSKSMPHLLFSGPPGVGKTAASVSLARELFGADWLNFFMELNSSDERGIDIVRGKIKDFARSSTVGDEQWKIIFLDESDALTTEAQAALRRTMEKYTDICRFILSVNYSSKVIEPIQSRCTVCRFKKIPDLAIRNRINYIAKEENLDISIGAVNAIIYIAQGDMRRAINLLQTTGMISNIIDADMIYQTASIPKSEDIEDLIMQSLQGNFLKAHEKLDYLMEELGFAGEDITEQIYREIFNIGVDDRLKMKLIDFVGEINFRVSEGASQRVQLGNLISKFMLYGINQ